MASDHLTPQTWHQLLHGELFEGREALVRHLEEDCEVCEKFLAERPPSLEDGALDAGLFRDASSEMPTSDLEFRRIMNRVRGPSRFVRAFSVAAAVAIAITAVFALRGGRPAGGSEQTAPGIKGIDSISEIEVSFAVAWHDASGATHLEKGVPGHSYPADRDILFRYRLIEPGYVAVVRDGEGGAEVVVDPAPAAAGEHDVEVAGRPAGYSLRSATGRQRFVVVYAKQLLSEADCLALARRTGKVGPGSAVASFDIQVQR